MAQLRDMCFRQTDMGRIETNLSSDSMQLLQAFDGLTPFGIIQQRTDLTAAVFKKCFLELFQKKLIEEVRAAPAAASLTRESFIESSVLEQLSEIAVQIVGPMGKILVAEAIEGLGLQPVEIPVSRLPDVIEAIKEEIPGEKQPKLFMEKLSEVLDGI